jgi:hypothetical protein
VNIAGFLPAVRIPVKWATYSAGMWATHSGGMWAGVRRADRRGNNIFTEMAHMGQGKSECGHHLVSIVSFSSSRLVCYIPVKWATIPVMWATPRNGSHRSTFQASPTANPA